MLAEILNMQVILTIVVIAAAVAFLATLFFLIDWVRESWYNHHVVIIDWTEMKGEGDEH